MDRWNKLPQHIIDSNSLNSFKNGLTQLRKTRMGFFMDWCPPGPMASPAPQEQVRPHLVSHLVSLPVMGALEMLWVWVLWVCTRPHYFCLSLDFTTSIVSQSVTHNRCAPHMGGTREKWGGTSKNFGGRIVPPLANCFRRHWHQLQCRTKQCACDTFVKGSY